MKKIYNYLEINNENAEQLRLNAEVIENEEKEKKYKLSGYASIFGIRSSLKYDSYYEIIEKGAFQNAISERQDVLFLINHNMNDLPLARVSNNTLFLREDEKGLYFEAHLNAEMTQTKDLINAIKRKDIFQMSFAYTVKDYEVKENINDQGHDEFIVKSVNRLYEVSAVSIPAFVEALIETNSEKLE
ncbi:MAG: HK97 family phage prohead protease, partial [bacterium]